MAIEIETSTDTPEEVKTALGATVEIEEGSPEEQAEEEEQPEKPAARKAPKAKEEPAEEPETDDEEEDDEEEEPEEEATEKKPKKQTPMVPTARLNEEIRKRRDAEARLAAKETPRKEEPAAEERPKTFSGKPEPTMEEFMVGVDKFDDDAKEKARQAHLKAVRQWDREEARAEAIYDAKVQEANERLTELRSDFEERKTAFAEQEPLYEELVPSSTVMLSDQQTNFVLDSEVGPHLLLYFVQHPKEAETIRRMKGRSQAAAMLTLEAEVMEEYGVELEAEKPPVRVKAPKATETVTPPKKPITSKAPQPPSRIKSAGPGPKTEQDLAGPTDRVGIDIDFNPAYEKAVAARRKI